jgi:hypothetical protein
MQPRFVGHRIQSECIDVRELIRRRSPWDYVDYTYRKSWNGALLLVTFSEATCVNMFYNIWSDEGFQQAHVRHSSPIFGSSDNNFTMCRKSARRGQSHDSWFYGRYEHELPRSRRRGWNASIRAQVTNAHTHSDVSVPLYLVHLELTQSSKRLLDLVEQGFRNFACAV